MSKLVCLSGMNKEDEFTLSEGGCILGRAPECDIVLFDKKCSRKHCQVFKKGHYYAIEDLQSRHGTFVNGKQISKRTSLSFGDKVKLGRTALVLSDKSAGGLVEQTATDGAADLTGHGYDKLMGRASTDAVKTHLSHKQAMEEDKGGLRGLIKQMFKK